MFKGLTIMAMGTWKRRIFAKLGKSKTERTKKARIYYAYPPKEGWPGGRPEDNGYRRGSSK